MKIKQHQRLIFLLILIAATTLRFYNLMWGNGYFFHPDERNMATAVSQLQLPEKISDIPSCFLQQLTIRNSSLEIRNCNLNPHFFAYGQFPLYLAYFPGLIFKIAVAFLTHNLQPTTYNLSFPQAVFWLRLWSATVSTFTVLLAFLITRKLLTFNFALLTATLVAFTPGLIQAAHFGTTESLLTFLFMVIVYLSLKLKVTVKNIQILNDFGLKFWTFDFRLLTVFAITMGLALGTKLSSLPFAVPFVTAFLIRILQSLKNKHRLVDKIIGLLGYWIIGLLILTGTAIILLMSSPYNILALSDFRGITNYEVGVATGDIRTFYTRQFEATTPFLFQIGKIFPYVLGLPLFILASMGFILILLKVTKFKVKTQKLPARNATHNVAGGKLAVESSKVPSNLNFGLLIILVSFLCYFIPNAILFAKWTRFMTPVLPLFAIFASYFLYQIINSSKIVLQGTQNSKLNIVPEQVRYSVAPYRSPIWYWGKAQNYSLNLKTFNFWVVVLTFTFCVLSLVPGIAFLSIYLHEDVRLTASRWIYQNIPSGSHVLSETANVIDIPVYISNINRSLAKDEGVAERKRQLTKTAKKRRGDYRNGPTTNLPSGASSEATPESRYNLQPTSFDFYHLDEDAKIPPQLVDELAKADYIFVPSRRLFANGLRRPEKYPLLTRYYQLLFSGELGFTKVAEFTSFPALIPGSHKPMNPSQVVSRNSGIMAVIKAHLNFLTHGYLHDEAAEETWTVFDHPVIRIYRKTAQKSPEDYKRLLEI